MSQKYHPRWYQEFFENMGIEYEDYPFTKDTENEVDWMIKEYLTEPEMKILDVGCGTGRHAINLASQGYQHITGIDLSSSMVEAAQKAARDKNLKVDFRACDARELPFNNEFDAAICLCEGAFSLLENDDENYKVLQAVYKAKWDFYSNHPESFS
jgi:ubiquinone/menaquinone biosynthesis C-methylase UbiE